MKLIISTTDQTHENILNQNIHLYKKGDKVEVRNNFCKKTLIVK